MGLKQNPAAPECSMIHSFSSSMSLCGHCGFDNLGQTVEESILTFPRNKTNQPLLGAKRIGFEMCHSVCPNAVQQNGCLNPYCFTLSISAIPAPGRCIYGRPRGCMITYVFQIFLEIVHNR